MYNISELQTLLNAVDSHRNRVIRINTKNMQDNDSYRTNEFFRVGKELKELAINVKTGQYDFEPINEHDLMVRYKAEQNECTNTVHELLELVECNRRLNRILNSASIKNIWTDGITLEIDCRTSSVTVIHGVGDNDKILDVDFWEATMKKIFVTDEAYNTIRKHIMLFAFTNYTELPQILFTGARGIGKNLYTSMLQSIFTGADISITEDIIESQYTSWMKYPLIICDEAMPKTPKTTRVLKSLGNHDSKTITEKYLLKEKYVSNATVIITSNENIPVYVRASEKPTDPYNCQYYLYHSPVESVEIDNTLRTRLMECTPRYIREVLAVDWVEFQDSDEYKKGRYHMRVPITEALIELFDDNMTQAEIIAEDVYDRIVAKIISGTNYTWFEDEMFITTDNLLKLFSAEEDMNAIKLKNCLKYDKKRFKKLKKQVDGVRKHGYIIKGITRNGNNFF